ncbi:MAG TPA: exodeoxyribonuclease VII large subunit [Candidatus Omnitrophica bacterium]|nr:exodeoxyribonuclease VII large subunit [Candidatus Omnitrophota bacterium]
MEDKGRYIYTVSQLSASIKIVLEDSFQNIWIEGEISNFDRPSSGHFYFTLKDERSELKCVFFKNSNEKIKFEIKDGMQVLCSGRISIYEKRGVYQLYVTKMEPRGVGELQLAFEQLKEKLFKEGLFEEAHKKEIPLLPERIGIVTSITGAAIRDILHVLNKRFSNVEVIINPVKVQGDGAREEIASAIEEFNALKNVDVMIVGRGGGSLEDLWAFNEEIVARAIYNSKIPIISAVGHEIDWTISDFVADMRAPTPSVAAEIVIAKKSELEDRLDEIEKKIIGFPMDIVKEYEQRLDEIEEGMVLRFRHYMELKEEGFKLLSEKLGILSPVGILDRGYSISFKLPDRKIIKNSQSLKKGDLVETKVSKGSFTSRIE